MKYLLIIICLFLSACMTAEQKLENDYLKAIHKAENKIASAKVNMALGATITAKGIEKLAEGNSEKKIASDLLEELLHGKSIINEDSPPETPQ